MASLRRHPKSPFWIACFSLPDGRRTTRTTRKKDKREAMQVAIDYEKASIAAKQKRLSDNYARRVIEDLYSIGNDELLVTISFSEYAHQWISRKQEEVSLKSFAKYKSVLDDAVGFLGAKSESDIRLLKKGDILDYRTYLGSRVTHGSVNVALKIIRSMFNDAVKEDILEKNPAKLVDLLKTSPKRTRRPFTDEELRAVLSVCDTEWRGMVLVGLYTGLRLGDIASLKWENLDVEKWEIQVDTSKTGRFQSIPAHAALVDYFKSVMPSRPFRQAAVFPRINSIHERDIHSGALSHQFTNILADAGLIEKPIHKRASKGRSGKRKQNELSFHCLRHTATSKLKRAGVSDAVARDLIGHESVAVSRQYTHMDSETKRRAIEAMARITE